MSISSVTAQRGALAVALALSACALDDRQLELAPEEEGSGASGGEDPGAGGGGSDGEGGTAGTGGTGDMNGLVDGCADLDTDGVPDCTTTLVKNPSFASDVAGWTALTNATLTWDPRNALDDLPSGSARLGTGPVPASAPRVGATQCVALAGSQLVIAYASAFVEATGDAADSAGAAIEVSFFESADCSGKVNGFFGTPPGTVTDAWTTIHAGGLSKDATQSILVALIANKAALTTEVSAYFDNVMLKAKPP
jgi:hypothetical protein